jgi:hypothetical protein
VAGFGNDEKLKRGSRRYECCHEIPGAVVLNYLDILRAPKVLRQGLSINFPAHLHPMD